MVNAQQILAVIIPVKQYDLCPYDNDIFASVSQARKNRHVKKETNRTQVPSNGFWPKPCQREQRRVLELW